MKHYILFALLSAWGLIPISVAAQDNEIRFNIGFGKRLGLLKIQEGNGYQVQLTPHFKSKDHFNPLNAAIDIKKSFFNSRLETQLSSYFRYGNNHFQRESGFQEFYAVDRFKMDFFVDGMYRIPINSKKIKNFSLLFGVGYGVINLNSRFDFSVFVGYDSTGNPQANVFNGSFKREVERILLGTTINKFDIMVIFHSVPDRYYNYNTTLMGEFKVTYRIAKIKI